MVVAFGGDPVQGPGRAEYRRAALAAARKSRYEGLAKDGVMTLR